MGYLKLPLESSGSVTSVNGFTGVVVLDKDDVGLTNIDNTSDATKNAAIAALTNKTIDAASNTISNISNSEIKAAAAIALNKLAATTASRALVSDASGFISASAVTSTTLAFLDATSSVQTQLNAKQATGNYITSLTGEVTASGAGAAAATITNSAVIGKVITGYVSGAGTVAATDTILQAINKLNGNNALQQPLATLTTKGDTYVATGASTVVRQAVGTNGYVIMADSGATNGLGYALPINDSKWINNVGATYSVGSSALTVAVKNSAGSDASATSPIYVSFRNATSATGTFSVVALTGALSLTISSGSTLGQRSAIASYQYWYLLNSAGTIKLAVSRMPYDDGSVVTTVAEGGAGAADSSSVMYSDAVYTGVASRIFLRILNTQTTAGTWAQAATELSLMPFMIKDIAGLMFKTSSQNPGTTAATKIVFSSVAAAERGFDPWSICDTSNSRLVAPKAGRYLVYFSLSGSNFEASSTLQVRIYLNNAATVRYDVLSNSIGATRIIPASIEMDLASGDYLEIFTSSTADSSYSFEGVSGLNDSTSYFGMNLIS